MIKVHLSISSSIVKLDAGSQGIKVLVKHTQFIHVPIPDHKGVIHSIDWENARIIDREQNWKKRRIKESLYIRNKDNYNLDSGLALSHVWDPLIGQASCMF